MNQLTFAVVLLAGTAGAAADRPNVVFILVDDYGWRDVGIEGSTFYETLHIDRIAREGMRFRQGYAACQVCSPSRASLMTGKFPARHGITDWIGAQEGRSGSGTRGCCRPVYRHALPADDTTLAEAFRGAGYRTFFAGKWHLGGPGSYPEDHGFEVNVGGFQAGSRGGGTSRRSNNPKLTDGPAGQSLPDRWPRERAAFIEAIGPSRFWPTCRSTRSTPRSRNDAGTAAEEISRQTGLVPSSGTPVRGGSHDTLVILTCRTGVVRSTTNRCSGAGNEAALSRYFFHSARVVSSGAWTE